MIKATLGGQPVTIHETATLDVGEFVRWSRVTENRLLGLDVEGYPFNHEDRMNHFGPLRSKWMRLIQFGSTSVAWNLDPLGVPSHRDAVLRVVQDRWHQFTTWGTFDPEAVNQCLGVDITGQTYDGMLLANLISPGPLEAHDLKEWSWRAGDTELRDAQEGQDARWKEMDPGAPRRPVRPAKPRKGESADEYAERLFHWRTDRLAAWQHAVQAHYAQYPRREEDRATLTGGFKSGWSGWRDIPRDDHRFQLYAGLDAIAVRRRWPELVSQTKERAVYRPLGFEISLAQAMTRVKIRGTKADRAYATERLNVVRPRHLSAKASFEQLTGVKATSPKRVDWLKDQGLRLNPKAVTKTGGPSFSGQHVKDYLAALAEDRNGLSEDGYRALELIKEAGETQNLTTFLGGLVQMMDPDDRIHPAFNTLGAETGRWTAREPAVQTFSNKSGTRGIIIPEPGHVLVSIDQAQIEVRVFAAASECGALIDAFNRGEDVYGTVAERLFGQGWTKRDRSLCKRIILGGCLYAGGAATLQTQLHDLDGLVIGQDKILETRTRFYSEYPEGRRFIRRMSSPRDVILPSGRYVPGDPDREYRGTNSYCQGTARDLMCQTLVRTFERGYESNLRLVCHDEGIYSLPVQDLDRQLEELTACFRVPFMDVKIDCDVELYPERWGGKMIEWKGTGRYETGPKDEKVTHATFDKAALAA